MFRRCAAVLCLLAAVLTKIDALFASPNSSDAGDLYRISKAFSKVCVLPGALFKIIRLARSPNVTRISSYQFDPVYLPLLNSEPLPKAVDVWRRRFAAMGVRGSLPDDDDFEKKLLTAGLKATVEQELSPRVHAEVKILKHLENQGLARRMINNTGVSKLCCPECYALLRAKDLSIGPQPLCLSAECTYAPLISS